MQIRYVEPLGRAWDRMRRTLFAPFDPGRWLVFAFAAWLSRIGESVGPRFTWRFRVAGDGGFFSGFQELEDRLGEIAPVPFLLPLLLALFGLAACCALVLAVVFLWLSSRGKFVFLHDVAHGRAEIVEPWKSYRIEGNSLFLWRLLFGVATLAIAAVAVAPLALLWSSLGGEEPAGARAGLFFAVAASALLPLTLAAAYVVCFLEHFVVPIMYRDRVRVLEGWRRFWRIFRSRPAPFLVYGLFLLLLYIGLLLLAILFCGCLSCCIGFLIVWLPYLGAVALLPVLFTFRAFGPEFLSQFGPDLWSWPGAPQPETGAAPPAASPSIPS